MHLGLQKLHRLSRAREGYLPNQRHLPMRVPTVGTQQPCDRYRLQLGMRAYSDRLGPERNSGLTLLSLGRPIARPMHTDQRQTLLICHVGAHRNFSAAAGPWMRVNTTARRYFSFALMENWPPAKWRIWSRPGILRSQCFLEGSLPLAVSMDLQMLI